MANLATLRTQVSQFAPNLIVNAAAYTAVDRAQSEAQLCHTVNAQAPAVLAEVADQIGAWLIHYSTDYVFNGTGTRAWRESDPIAPLNVYGESKAAGEALIRERCERHLILRTSWVYAAHGQNFLRTILRLAAERDTIKVVSDQLGAPTSAELLAQATVQAFARTREGAVAGTYHVTPTGETSWFDYARLIVSTMRELGIRLKLAPENIVPLATANYPTAAARPLNSRLDTTKLRTQSAFALPAWEDDVVRTLHELAPGLQR